MKHRVYILALVLLVTVSAVFTVEARPRMVVNVVVCGLRQSDLTRYEKNFGKGGFLRLRDNGVSYTECYADYAPTTSEAGLATLATGALPATHGIFSSVLFDRTSNKEERLTYLPKSDRTEVQKKGLESGRSTSSFIAPTLSEAVVGSSEQNRVVTIAHNSLSAMILAGRRGECYWMNDAGKWASADCYMSELPSWVATCNNNDMNKVFATDNWYGRYTSDRYINKFFSDLLIYEKSARRGRTSKKPSGEWVKRMRVSPSGNLAILEFAKSALVSMLPLHVDDECKMLNICLDVPRAVAEKYGPDSVEYEDMLYSLDEALAEFLTFLYAQIPAKEDVVVVLSSDGGVSPARQTNSDATRFNTRQFEVIINAFLSARYGQDSWVLGYTDGSLYLNHDVIYRQKKSVEEVQNEAATFALQYRGVSTAVTATALRSAQFSKGALALVQNGYNPRRSGDVLLVLDVERIEFDPYRVAMSGSVYSYDRHIPFIVCGANIAPQKISSRVSSDQIAPSVAALFGLARPYCSDAAVLTFTK